MHASRDLAFYVFVVSVLTMVIGLFVPWITLWWMAIQNRKRVIQLYGSIAFVSYLLYLIL
jgi:adenine-specific DNA methylase